MQELKNLATFHRYIWEEPKLLVVTGEATSLLEGARVYNQRYGIQDPPAEQISTFTRLLGATSLAAVSLADRESWGWSIALPNSGAGFFVGVEPEGMICCTQKDTPDDRRVAVIQRQKPEQQQTQSHITPPDEDPVHLVEHYFDAAMQTPTRIALENDARTVLVQAMPGGRLEEVNSLDDEQLIQLIYRLASTEAFHPVGEVLMYYECRCHDETVLRMMEDLPESTRQELWQNKEELEMECPRCSRKFVIQKNSRPRKE